MARKKLKSAPSVLNPVRGCKFCGGFGWVEQLVAPAAITRNVPGLLRQAPPPRTPVERCSCTKPERRDQMVAPEPAPAALDSAQRASGEKED